MKKQLLLLVFMSIMGTTTHLLGQNCYIRLQDASGLNTDSYQADLEEAACALVATFPEAFQDSFKVYDFGFYLHNEVMEGSFPAVFERMIDVVAAESPYYLIFGKQTDSEGIYTKFWVDLKLPETGSFECMSDNQRSGIVSDEMIMLNENFNDFFDYANREIAVMIKLKKQIVRSINCCDNLGEKSMLNSDLLSIKVCVDNGCEGFEERDVALISDIPNMPQISFTLLYYDEISCVAPLHCYLKVYYNRLPRTDDEVLIDIGEVELEFSHEIEYPTTTFLAEDWNVIQGGRAELIVNDASGEFIKSFEFSIKGQNPRASDVFNYTENTPQYNDLWFLKEMIIHESASFLQNDSNQPIKQFNSIDESTENLWDTWEASSRCPNQSSDQLGWGMGQLTNTIGQNTLDKLTLWDWKANIAYMKHMMIQNSNTANPTRMNKTIANRIHNLDNWTALKQWNEANGNNKVTLNEEYAGVTWRLSPSPLFVNLTNQSLNQFYDVLGEGERSVLDGCLIKYYNDGNTSNLFMYIIVPASGKPTIKLQDNAGPYVNKVLTTSIPQY